MERFQTLHPFALEGLLIDGRRLLKELGDETLLELGSGGQTAFEKVIAPFCERLDFDQTTKLASRFYPEGAEAGVVIDPQHAFGRPIVNGTNITTEALACLIRGGEKIEDVAQDFRLEQEQAYPHRQHLPMRIHSDWCLNHADTHLLREIRTLPKDFVLEIGRELDGQIR
jgi:uncharacterized protein (DUF433 family)